MQWYKQTLFFLWRSCCWEISTGLAQVQQLRFRFLGRHWKVVLQPAKKQNTAKVQMISLRTLVKFGWDSVVNARCISSSFSLAFFLLFFFFPRWGWWGTQEALLEVHMQGRGIKVWEVQGWALSSRTKVSWPTAWPSSTWTRRTSPCKEWLPW